MSVDDTVFPDQTAARRALTAVEQLGDPACSKLVIAQAKSQSRAFQREFEAKVKDTSASGDAGHGGASPDEAKAAAAASGAFTDAVLEALVQLWQLKRKIRHKQPATTVGLPGEGLFGVLRCLRKRAYLLRSRQGRWQLGTGSMSLYVTADSCSSLAVCSLAACCSLLAACSQPARRLLTTCSWHAGAVCLLRAACSPLANL